jgi:aerobic-type carbon monoxide dehydrogenase small subunit (CoxS/CutS family)
MSGTMHEIAITVNGEPVRESVEARRTLVDFLREDLGLTGSHIGCEHGVCGACTIIINGRAARSCLTFAVQVAGTEVRTIESVADPNGDLHPLQQAFQDCHALQCGYCTPGIIMNVLSWFETSPNLDLSDEGVREMLSGNLCRCTGYQNIVTAVCQAAEAMRLGRGS